MLPATWLFELFQRVNITPATFPMLHAMLELGSAILMDEATRGGAAGMAGAKVHVKATSLKKIQEAVHVAFRSFDELLTSGDFSYRVYLHKAASRTGQGPPVPVLSYWCFTPGLAMRELLNLGVRSLVRACSCPPPLKGGVPCLGLGVDALSVPAGAPTPLIPPSDRSSRRARWRPWTRSPTSSRCPSPSPSRTHMSSSRPRQVVFDRQHLQWLGTGADGWPPGSPCLPALPCPADPAAIRSRQRTTRTP